MRIENGILLSLEEKTRDVFIPGSARIIAGKEHGKPLAMNYDVEKLFLGDGVEIIENEAFLGCTNLKEITLPASIQKIGEMAFYGTVLEKVVFNGEMKDFLRISIATVPACDFTVVCTDGEIYFRSKNRS